MNFIAEMQILIRKNKQLRAENRRLKEENRWIPVSERLPKPITNQVRHSQDVLIAQSKWGVCIGYYQHNHHQWVKHGSYQRPQEYQNEVTHWKPIILPEQALKE